MNSTKVGIVGFGRFGRMVHGILSRHCPTCVYDRSPAALAGLKERAGFEQVLSCPVVVLCVPISEISRIGEQLAAGLRPGQLVVDTCSVKMAPLQTLSETLPAEVHILGTHPLFGPDSGAEGVAGLKIVVCPVRVGKEQLESVEAFLRELGLIVIHATPEEHDDQIARTQAVFHLIAQALKELEWGALPIATPGPEAFFRLAGTVQKDTRQLFLDMQSTNPFAARYRRAFLDKLSEIEERIERQAE